MAVDTVATLVAVFVEEVSTVTSVVTINEFTISHQNGKCIVKTGLKWSLHILILNVT